MALIKTQVSDLTIAQATSAGTDVIRASWKYPTSITGELQYFKNFEVIWKYTYGETTKSKGGETIWYTNKTTVSSHDTDTPLNWLDFSIPSVDITKVKTMQIYVKVKPTASGKKVKVIDEDGNEKDKPVNPAWTGKEVKSGTITYDFVASQTPEVPSVNVELVGKAGEQRIKMSVTGYGIQQHARSVQFQTRRNTKKDSGKTYNKNLSSTGTASVTTSNVIAQGSFYEIRVRGFQEANCKGKHSNWSRWTDPIMGPPKTPKGSFVMQLASRPGDSGNVANIKMEDHANPNPDDTLGGYELQYTIVKNDFEYNRVGVAPGSGSVMMPLSGNVADKPYRDSYYLYRYYLQNHPEQLGKKYFYRLRAYGKDSETNVSGWTSTFEFIYGEKPSSPTVWFTKNIFEDDENIDIHFAHNSTDGSYADSARIMVKINDEVLSNWGPKVVDLTNNPNEAEPTYAIPLGTISELITGLSEEKRNQGKYVIKVQVATKGISDEYSEYSAWQTCTVWPKPYVDIIGTGGDGWLWDPFNFLYDSTLTAFDGSEFESPVKHFPMFIEIESGNMPQQALYYVVRITALNDYNTLNIDGTDKHIYAGDVIYQVNVDPTQKANGESVGNYGWLRIDAWDITLVNDQQYELSVDAIMNSGLTANTTMIFETDFKDYDFEPDGNIIMNNESYSLSITPTLSQDMEYEIGENMLTISDVIFHIFRRNYDDSMTNIITALTGDYETAVIDPHPMMNGGLYRIVAMSKITGEITYVDVVSPAFDIPGIMIQWNTEYQDYEIIDSADYDKKDTDLIMFGSGMGGSSLFLPYNIDASNSYAMDVEMVEYLGREHPVSYYGTQKGESLSLSTVIPKEGSEDIILAMRRLSNYRGDCYIREPSGTGFWARIEISFNINHLETTIPISITATRVEGGI